MKISIFIVTYKNDLLLNKCLQSIFRSEDMTNDKYKIDVNILNNYPILNIDEEFRHKVNTINNNARPSFSTGHLSRSWNQCILNGIEDINNPKCDVLILTQQDVLFENGFIEYICDNLNTYNFMTFGTGDEVQVMTPESIKTIGLYDERFCNIGFQEADYFLRALVLNRNKSSINDMFHNRIHNAILNKVTQETLTGFQRNDIEHIRSSRFHSISRNVFTYKWFKHIPNGDDPENWGDNHLWIKTAPKQYMMYPYFECALPNLNSKYIVQ
jgi:hypothetical protein